MSEKPISNSRFVVGILQNMDIAQNLGTALTFSMDLSRAATPKAQIDNQIAGILGQTQDLTKMGTQDGETIIKKALSTYKSAMPSMNEYLYAGAAQSSAGFRMTASIIASNAKYYSEIMHLDLFTQCLIDIPESIIKTRVRKWYNKAFHVEEPGDRDFYTLMINGYRTPAEYIMKFREDMSFSNDDATHLALIRNWQYGVPSPHDAWVMVQRGYWLKSDWLKLMTLGQGWTATDAEALYKMYNYDPSIGDVMSLSNLIPLDPLWVAEKFNRTGMSAADKAVFIAGMNKKVITQEIRTMWSQILQVYAYGGYTETELTNLLTAWQFTQAEINIKIETAELVKSKTVNTLMRDADIYLYRQGVITESTATGAEPPQLYERLIAQGIPSDVANAITRNEACKKANDWELPY